MSNLPFTKDETVDETALLFALASFIGWQVAVVNTTDEVLGSKIVNEAEKNITKLMTGESLQLGETDVTINNEIGKGLAKYLEEHLNDIVNVLAKKIANMEVPNAAV